MRRTRLAALPLVWVLGATGLLAACSSESPEARLQGRLDAIILDANDRNADSMRTSVELFLSEVNRQSREGMASSRVTKLRELAKRVLDDAKLIDKRVAEAEASASAQAKADREAAAAATRSAQAEAKKKRDAEEKAAKDAEATRAAEASAEPTEEPQPEPTESDGGGIIPTTAPVGGKRQPSPTPTP